MFLTYRQLLAETERVVDLALKEPVLDQWKLLAWEFLHLQLTICTDSVDSHTQCEFKPITLFIDPDTKLPYECKRGATLGMRKLQLEPLGSETRSQFDLQDSTHVHQGMKKGPHL